MFRFSQALVALSLVAALALAGCVPISPTADGGTVPVAPATEAPGTVPAPQVDATATAIIEAGGAVATVATRSLRVRELPTSASTQVGSILNGESYKVIARSSDGMWLELDIPALGGSGWVTADLITMAGDITDLPIVTVPTPVPPTATPVLLPTPTPADATAPVTETVATTATVEPVAPTEIPTEVPTEAPTLAPATPVTETAPVTATVPVEVTPTPTAAPIVAPPAGFVAVNSQVRLRVRSEPTTEGENIIGYAYPGEVFEVIEQSADGAWTRVAGSATSRENPNGGWVTSEFLLFGQ